MAISIYFPCCGGGIEYTNVFLPLSTEDEGISLKISKDGSRAIFDCLGSKAYLVLIEGTPQIVAESYNGVFENQWAEIFCEDNFLTKNLTVVRKSWRDGGHCLDPRAFKFHLLKRCEVFMAKRTPKPQLESADVWDCRLATHSNFPKTIYINKMGVILASHEMLVKDLLT